MSEEINLGVGICENRRNSITGYLMVCGHSPKENFEF